MRYKISHQTTYTYSQAVELAPHVVRLRPRCSSDQSLLMFQLQVSPLPKGESQILDEANNPILQLWWPELPTSMLSIQIMAEVETHCINPFQFLLHPWATQLPLDYPRTLHNSLSPYLGSAGFPGGIDPVAHGLAWEIATGVDNNLLVFLSELNQKLYATCGYQTRETGEPWPPCLTWQRQSGSCRDLTVLFIHACRAVGLAARFVSGYQEGDEDSPERHLHAWAEVYLPGAGWRGYDPTHGLAVADRHIALVAAAQPEDAAPITGTVRGKGATAAMTYQLQISRT
ncbi:transglutaminase family protein [Candidatus Synechococcus calcipolaris G9]|uniref:Transglutaminase family protein n=1 Tax=Candidatus Synechococcus calcipolaris G9 TaxID=1497997 RepID=A0ABT6EYI3_9SYNE|nr:transglutaminase family protein [Candidatus Synechococcus calcipolaris]MDG2990797.1 transglutaminase family protein [Candidatus Synechococcus calcipolaris G9]